jgi:hypothetical protein
MTSSTDMQASLDRPEAAALDPENDLLWRQNRRRLEFESMRDAMLAASGKLDRKVYGKPAAIFEPPYPPRRTIYGHIDRQNLEPVYRTFDFASPDSSSPGRPQTTVPQQALFLMNSPLVDGIAGALADRAGVGEPAAQVGRLYAWLFARPPSQAELDRATLFLGSFAGLPVPGPAWQHGLARFDESSGRVADFRPLPHWTGTAWQAGPQFPHPELHYAQLTRDGGHAGHDAAHAVVRRWTAPFAGEVKVEGTLAHGTRDGDGVRGRVVSSRQGQAGVWEAHNAKAATVVERIAVEPGDTIDFLVDCRSGDGFDSFTWAPKVSRVDGAAPSGEPTLWDARADFGPPGPPPIRPLQAYAQALLMTNEFLFVD